MNPWRASGRISRCTCSYSPVPVLLCLDWPVSPGTWPGGGWVPWWAAPLVFVLCRVCDMVRWCQNNLVRPFGSPVSLAQWASPRLNGHVQWKVIAVFTDRIVWPGHLDHKAAETIKTQECGTDVCSRNMWLHGARCIYMLLVFRTKWIVDSWCIWWSRKPLLCGLKIVFICWVAVFHCLCVYSLFADGSNWNRAKSNRHYVVL